MRPRFSKVEESAVGRIEAVARQLSTEVRAPLVEGHDAVADPRVVGRGSLGVVDAVIGIHETTREDDVDRQVLARLEGLALDGQGGEVELGAVRGVIDADHFLVDDRSEDGVVGLRDHLGQVQPLDLCRAQRGCDEQRGRRERQGKGGCSHDEGIPFRTD